jgi:low temperature requirement protein LtrA
MDSWSDRGETLPPASTEYQVPDPGPDEPACDRRAAPPASFELLFDLIFVVAIAAVTAQLPHGITDGHGLATARAAASALVARPR